MGKFGRKVIFGCGLALALVLCGFILFQTLIAGKIGAVSPAARPAIEAVMTAQLLSKISGSYWENEMIKQSTTVARLSLQERLDYFRTILLQSDLDTSRALVFVEAVGSDAEALHAHLISFKDGPLYGQLSPEQRHVVESWIRELEIIILQRKADEQKAKK